MTRYDNLRQLRWDDKYCEGQYINIARPAEPTETGVYHYAATARRLCGGRGFAIPAIIAPGHIDSTTAMDYKSFVRHLREGLQCIGFSEDAANVYAGQSLRAGAATAGVANGLQPHELCRAAGVSSINWDLWYNRYHLADRIRISRSLGL